MRCRNPTKPGRKKLLGAQSFQVLGQYKRQKGKMQRRSEVTLRRLKAISQVLEKENSELRLRNEKKEAQLTKEAKNREWI